MKKVFIITCTLLLLLIGCDKKESITTESEQSTTQGLEQHDYEEESVSSVENNIDINVISNQQLKEVFENKKTFLDTETQNYLYLDDYSSTNYMYPNDEDIYEYIKDADDSSERIEILRWAEVDMDLDGNTELLLELSNSNILVLHAHNEVVYGYAFPYRGMNGVKKDGTFQGSGSAADIYIGNLQFIEEQCVYNEICVIDELDLESPVYRIDKQNSTKEDVQTYIKNQEQKEEVLWNVAKKENKFIKVEPCNSEEEILYQYTLFDAEGNVTHIESDLNREPNIEELDNGIIKIAIGAGTAVNMVRYYDSINNKVSENFITPWDEYGTKLIRFEINKLIVQDMFDESAFYKEYDISLSPTAVAENMIESARFIDDNTVEVVYLTGEEQREVTEIFEFTTN